MTDESLDLKKYYKFVLKCQICKRPFGVDTKDEDNLCPICQEKSNGKKCRFAKFIEEKR